MNYYKITMLSKTTTQIWRRKEKTIFARCMASAVLLGHPGAHYDEVLCSERRKNRVY